MRDSPTRPEAKLKSEIVAAHFGSFPLRAPPRFRSSLCRSLINFRDRNLKEGEGDLESGCHAACGGLWLSDGAPCAHHAEDPQEHRTSCCPDSEGVAIRASQTTSRAHPNPNVSLQPPLPGEVPSCCSGRPAKDQPLRGSAQTTRLGPIERLGGTRERLTCPSHFVCTQC